MPSHKLNTEIFPAKLKIESSRQPDLSAHRSGWPWALKALGPLHRPDGVLFDSFLERTFCWMKDHEVSSRRIPYTEPWVGMIHNPPGVPIWHDYHAAPQEIIKLSEFQDSLEFCQGLFVLSNYLRDWLSMQVNVPVESLVHPTDLDVCQFDFEKYRRSPNRCLIQIGWWLRRMTSIFRLPISKIQKCLLNIDAESWRALLDREQVEIQITEQERTSVTNIDYLSNKAYDQLLSENIVFVDLYDSSANNAVIECIARHTPLLINPLPAVQEYLGEDYPFYFHSLEEAALKAEDLDLVEETARYMSRLPKHKLDGINFCTDLVNTSIYQHLSTNASCVDLHFKRPRLSASYVYSPVGPVEVDIEICRNPSGQVAIDWLEIRHDDVQASYVISQEANKVFRGLTLTEAKQVARNVFYEILNVQEERYLRLRDSVVTTIQIALQKFH